MDSARRLGDRLHLVLAILTAWLILTSPWVAMLRRIPEEPGFFDAAHIWVGAITALLALPYLVDCLRNARWRLYFPWAGGRLTGILADLRGLARGRTPSAEGGGLFGSIEGLALIALVGTGATGLGWLWAEDTSGAIAWRSYHVLCARIAIGAIIVHAISVALHVLDFVRD